MSNLLSSSSIQCVLVGRVVDITQIEQVKERNERNTQKWIVTPSSCRFRRIKMLQLRIFLKKHFVGLSYDDMEEISETWVDFVELSEWRIEIMYKKVWRIRLKPLSHFHTYFTRSNKI